MNTKRITPMRHRRLVLKKTDKEKEHYFVIEAAAQAAAMATADAIRNHEEENRKIPRLYLSGIRRGKAEREAFVKIHGAPFKNNLADYIRDEMERNLAFYPFECKLQETGFAGVQPKGREGWQHLYISQVAEKTAAKLVMREVPKMSVEKSQAISRRMFARTADDMAQELYDDAE